MNVYQIIWFWLVLFLFAVYAALDGFDLGSGIWRLFTKDEEKKKAILGAIAPYWDGNEVWLVAAGTCLFAAFPVVYATVFSGFYLAIILLGVAFMFRAVSIEFRNKYEGAGWKGFWDAGIGLGSLIPPLIFGVAIGNLMRGVPISSGPEYGGTFWGLFDRYSLLIGIFAVVMFSFHGAVHLGDRKKAGISGVIYALLFAAVVLVSYFGYPHLFENFRSHPHLYLLVAANMALLCILIVKPVFSLSFVSIIVNMLLAGCAMYPVMVFASPDPALSLTAANASSSLLTLKTMLVITGLGLPVAIGYTLWFYKTFKRGTAGY